jgi:hypothetical protein
MLDDTLTTAMTREELLARVLASEREMKRLLEHAATLSHDSEERALFARLARREEDALQELLREEQRLDAENFVQRALDC